MRCRLAQCSTCVAQNFLATRVCKLFHLHQFFLFLLFISHLGQIILLFGKEALLSFIEILALPLADFVVVFFGLV